MQLGVVGLGRMGGNIVRRLMRAGHDCVVHDRDPAPARALAAEGAQAAGDLASLVAALEVPRAVWVMLPAGEATEGAVGALAALLSPGDTVIDGGNSFWKDDVRRAAALSERGLAYLDVGTSGGVWGLERGYCLMIGGDAQAVARLEPIFATLAPGRGTAARTPGRDRLGGTAEDGYLHCGSSGGGHFVKMVHNGIEYGLMAAYAEGLNILNHANVGDRGRTIDAETTPLRNPEHYKYSFNLADITELWRRGSVVASWLLDLTAMALLEQPDLKTFSGRVSDSGEGRWTVTAAIDEGVPAPVLSASLYQRFSSRGEDDFAAKTLSAMRAKFGGHVERPTGG